MIPAKLIIALVCLNASAIHGRSEAAADQKHLEDISSAEDEPAAAFVAEKVEFLGYVNNSQVFERDTDCRQWPAHNEKVTIGEVWLQEDGWYAQTLKMWNHRHAFVWGFCVETRFGGDKDSGQFFYAQAVSDDASESVWALQAYKTWDAQLTMGVVGWNADKARWSPCTNVPGCGGGSRFAMHKNQCSRFKIKSGRVIQACKTTTNEGYRICGEASRKHHGRNRCGTGRDSHYWFGTEEGCQYN